jgi:hypothetical protein
MKISALSDSEDFSSSESALILAAYARFNDVMNSSTWPRS